MATRKFKATLSSKEINDVIKQLEEYRKVTLPSKLEQAISQLIDRGIRVAQSNVGDFGAFITFDKQIQNSQEGCTGILLGFNSRPNISVWYNSQGEQNAEISSILMAEFGSGVHAESTQNIEQKSHRGTFPNQTHAFQKKWAYYSNVDQYGKPIDLVWTDGIEPTMPMYRASMEMYNEIGSVFRSVFR